MSRPPVSELPTAIDVRALVTGSRGQVGADLVAALPVANVLALGHTDLDVGDPHACLQIIPPAGPEVVFHLAAYTDVDGCESNPDRAWRDNAIGAQNVALAARAAGASLIVVSTDYVFDGSSSEPYEEYAPVSPLSVYGRTKAAGERAAMEANPGATAIVRSSWIYGATGGNFVKTVLRLAGERDVLDVVDDQIGAPTWSHDLAEALVLLARSKRTGVYQATNSGSVSWHGFAQEVFRVAGLDPARVHPTTTEKLARPAQRPPYSVLSDRLWRLAGFPPLRQWRAALRAAMPGITASMLS